MKLYKYCAADFYLDANIMQHHIFFNKIDNVNDLYEGFFKIKIAKELMGPFFELFYGSKYDDRFNGLDTREITNSLIDYCWNWYRQNVGIACFTTNNKSIPMWGLYADKQRGVCLEFDNEYKPFSLAKQVIYTDDVFTFDINSLSQIKEEYFTNVGSQLMFRKYNEWRNEDEYRLIYKKDSFIEYEPQALTGIYFGYKTPTDTIRRLFTITKQYEHIRYYRPRFSRDRYEMFFDEVTEKDLRE